MKTHVYSSITLILLLTGGFLGCGPTVECRDRFVSASTVPFMDPISGFCGTYSVHDLLSDRQDVNGMLRMHNNPSHWYLEFKLEETRSIEGVYLHFSPTPHFPLDEQQNPDISSFSHKLHFHHPASLRRFIVHKNEVPLKGFLSICVVYRDPKTFHRCGMGKLWVDGIRYGSSERGRYFSYSWKNCLTQEVEPINQ